MKYFTGCGRTKPTDGFHKNKRVKDGLSRICKACKRDSYLKNSNPPRRRGIDPNAPSKDCAKCEEHKDRDEFYVDKSMPSNMSSWCKECSIKAERLRRERGWTGKRPPYDGDPNIDTRLCNSCQEEKPLALFAKDKSRWNGYGARCLECKSKQKKEARYQKEYGLTIQEIDKLRGLQEYRCANPGCRVHEDDTAIGLLVVDHCHETGIVRGLLCSGCNTSEGLLRSDPNRMVGLAEYIKSQIKKAPDDWMITWYEPQNKEVTPNKR